VIVRLIDIQVKPERIEEFQASSLRNHRGSIQEPGVLRFDLLQSASDPGRFLLYEAYRDEAATLVHKETAHYLAWKQEVEPMLAAPRQASAFKVLAPTDPSAWKP
jgi:autoinducer 2-degrading protein